MNQYWLILLILAVLIIIPGVSAEWPHGPNFSVAFNYDDFSHYNESYNIYKQQSTPKWIFDTFMYLGFGCLFLSFILTPKQRADYFGYLAPLPFLISSLMCTGLSGIDVVNGYGAGAVIAFTQPTGVVQGHEFVLLMGHNIYFSDILAVFLLIMFIISLINCFRVYQEHELFQQSVGMGAKDD